MKRTLIGDGVCEKLPLEPSSLDAVLLGPARPRSQPGLLGRRGDLDLFSAVSRESGLDIGHDELTKGSVDIAFCQLQITICGKMIAHAERNKPR